MTSAPRPLLRNYFIATRPWSFPASLAPMLVGGMLAYAEEGLDLPLFALTLLGGLLFHIGANLVNTYFDYRNGVDTPEGADDRTLVDGLLYPKEEIAFAVVVLAAGSAVGAALTAAAGPGVLVLGAIGAAMAVLYTAGPALKYHALGDLAIFVSFGPLLTVGAFYVQTGDWSLAAFAFSLPMGLLIDAIVHANNIRDVVPDRAAGALTLAQLLGTRGAAWDYRVLVLLPYALAVAFAVSYSAWALLPLLTLPLVRPLLAAIGKGTAESLALLPQRTAQFEAAYGLVTAAGLLASTVF